MKYIPSIAFEEMSGSAKGVTAAKTMGRKYIRNRGYGGGTRTAAQAAVKSVFKQLSQGWKSLTNEQILAWNRRADPRMEQPRPLPGRPLRPRYLLQDHRQQPLYEAQLLDRLLRRGSPDGPAHAPRGGGPFGSRHLPHRRRVHLHPRLRAHGEHGRPEARHHGQPTPSPRRTWPT